MKTPLLLEPHRLLFLDLSALFSVFTEMAIHSSNSASLVALLMDSSEDHRTVDGARWGRRE